MALILINWLADDKFLDDSWMTNYPLKLYINNDFGYGHFVQNQF